jgi:hypothetical protein
MRLSVGMLLMDDNQVTELGGGEDVEIGKTKEYPERHSFLVLFVSKVKVKITLHLVSVRKIMDNNKLFCQDTGDVTH